MIEPIENDCGKLEVVKPLPLPLSPLSSVALFVPCHLTKQFYASNSRFELVLLSVAQKI